ncbi:hypothetical protein GIB67_040016 [Kingdonia uniflora]|uniref:Uncharacterized protein n=1 Tax=Kingdonia uniflora TaxID=39325 RepID=A0A7J7MUM5_9MAGN|nr:hypothetical protein GIB67_040016 [Kingdonia uniflora]
MIRESFTSTLTTLSTYDPGGLLSLLNDAFPLRRASNRKKARLKLNRFLRVPPSLILAVGTYCYTCCYTLNNGSFVEFIESSFHYTVKEFKKLLFIMDVPEESPHILPAGTTAIRSTPSNDNSPSNRMYTTNDIMSPSLLTPSTENALSRRTLAQRGRRKRERDRVSSQPSYIILEESSTLLLDSVTILEEQSCIMHSPNIPYPIMRSTSNFPSSTFEIGESSSARANVVRHNVEAVYYNPIESDDERNIDDEGNDNVKEVDEGNITDNDEGVQLGRCMYTLFCTSLER